MFWRRFKQAINDWLDSSVRERQRILWILPLLVVLCLLFLWVDKPRFERSFTLYSDAVSEQARAKRSAPDYAPSLQAAPPKTFSRSEASPNPKTPRAASLFPFDPNTIDRAGLVRLGFSPKQAQVILRYREAGAVFRRPEDFARCYTVSEEKYAELAPYIRIGDTYRSPATQTRPTRSAPQSGEGGIAPENEAAPKGGPAGEAQDHQPKAVRVATAPSPVQRIELNTADSASLVALRGIGPLSAGRILRYRQRLGGFARAEQLREVQGVLEENYRLILQQIFVDSSNIQKIDINFASPERMATHPYLPPRTLDKILKNRQLKGGWRSTRELEEQHILSGEQAARLAPYLCFGTK